MKRKEAVAVLNRNFLEGIEHHEKVNGTLSGIGTESRTRDLSRRKRKLSSLHCMVGYITSTASISCSKHGLPKEFTSWLTPSKTEILLRGLIAI
jgi:hypothetical protein